MRGGAEAEGRWGADTYPGSRILVEAPCSKEWQQIRALIPHVRRIDCLLL